MWTGLKPLTLIDQIIVLHSASKMHLCELNNECSEYNTQRKLLHKTSIGLVLNQTTILDNTLQHSIHVDKHT